MKLFGRRAQADPQADPQGNQGASQGTAPGPQSRALTSTDKLAHQREMAAMKAQERKDRWEEKQQERQARQAEKQQQRQAKEQRQAALRAEKQQRWQERRALGKAALSRVGALFPKQQQPTDHLEQVRQEVEKFDEDKRHPLEHLLIFIFTVAAYVLPVVIAVYIGWEIGDAYGGVWRAGNSFSQGMHITAFAGEIAQAMFVIAISFAARAFARNRENLWLLVIACTFFVIFILASGLAQWYVSKLYITPTTNAGKAGLLFRVAMPALFDIGAALFLAIVNVKNLKRFLQQQGQKAEAIEQVNRSILRIEEAQEEAKQRKEQHQQYLDSMKATQGLVIDLQRIITGRILDEARGQQARSVRTTIESQPTSEVPQLPARRVSQEEQEREEGTEETRTSVPIPAEQSHQRRYVEVAADQLQRTIEALTANPNITDEELAEVLGLKRTASARYWRLKAVDLLMGHQSPSTTALPEHPPFPAVRTAPQGVNHGNHGDVQGEYERWGAEGEGRDDDTSFRERTN
jgi:hypothetical protein